jgi:hypothetical protein
MRAAISFLFLLAPAFAQTGGWTRLSSRYGDIPAPFPGKQQTAALAADLDKDGAADLILSDRMASPSLVWMRRTGVGWQRYVVDHMWLRIEAGGVAFDVDSDGDLDLIFGGDAGSNQMWWWENPHPKHEPGVPWKRRLIKNSGGNKHHDQVVGDFDGDGKPELVFWNQMGRKLLRAPVPADPRATEPWPQHAIFEWTGREMEGISAFDVNGDGKVDIVGGGRWFEHVSGETFREHVIDDAQRFSRAAAGQLVPGGWAEVVFAVGDGIGRLKWYERRGEIWTGHDLLNQDVQHGHTLQLGDVDRDGNFDIYCAEMGKWIGGTPGPNNPHPRSWIFYGDGRGGFQTQLVSRGFGTHEGRLADLDGDGDLDIYAKPYNHDAPRIDVLINGGKPRSVPAPLALDRWRRHVVDENKPWRAIFIDSLDVDGDGRRDIATGGWWYRNPGAAGGEWKRTMIGEPFRNLAAIGDFDNDGLMDLLGTEGRAAEANSRFVWAQNRGGGQFILRGDVPAGEGDFLQGATAVAVQGGPVSIALSWHKAGAGIQLLHPPRGTPPGPWQWERILADSQDEELSVGDIDRDGAQDLLAGTWWLKRTGTTWKKYVLHPTGGDPDRNRLADVNNDGRLDAVVGFEAINKPGKLAWYEQPADLTGTWTEHVIADVVGPMSLDVADLDGDGDLDLVVGEHNYAKPETAALWVYENVDGAGLKWRPHRVHTGDEHHDGARLVDIDNDGDLDIISIGWSHARVLVYENLARSR